jgi:hypothetical protein
MINVKIVMVNGDEYNVRNIADSVHDFHKRVIAPYGTNMSFVEILPGTLIGVNNIVSIRELSDEEVDVINQPKEEVVGLTDTEVVVEDQEIEESEK